MVRINLLPWRAERRERRKKQFMIMLVAAALSGLVLWFLIDRYYAAQISGQEQRNAYIQDEIKKLEKQIEAIKELDKKKARLLGRKAAIEELQASRSQMVHLFDSLVRTIPDGVVLTGIKQAGTKLTLEGLAQSNTRVSNYMRQLETAGWMKKPELSIIEAQDAQKGDAKVGLPYEFKLDVTLANPNAPADEDGDGVPDEAPAAAPAATGAAQQTPAAATTGASQ